MAGSPEYLKLLDIIERGAHDPSHPGNDHVFVWEDIDNAWNLLVTDPERESYLMALADTSLRMYAQERGVTVADIVLTARESHINKNAGYAGADNPDPWANFRLSEIFGISPVRGVFVRMSDKYIRITNLRKDASNERVGENILDTLLDLAAYALIALCLVREGIEATLAAEFRRQMN